MNKKRKKTITITIIMDTIIIIIITTMVITMVTTTIITMVTMETSKNKLLRSEPLIDQHLHRLTQLPYLSLLTS